MRGKETSWARFEGLEWTFACNAAPCPDDSGRRSWESQIGFANVTDGLSFGSSSTQSTRARCSLSDYEHSSSGCSGREEVKKACFSGSSNRSSIERLSKAITTSNENRLSRDLIRVLSHIAPTITLTPTPSQQDTAALNFFHAFPVGINQSPKAKTPP